MATRRACSAALAIQPGPTSWPQAALNTLIAAEQGLVARAETSVEAAKAANARLQQLRDAVKLVSALRARRSELINYAEQELARLTAASAPPPGGLLVRDIELRIRDHEISVLRQNAENAMREVAFLDAVEQLAASQGGSARQPQLSAQLAEAARQVTSGLPALARQELLYALDVYLWSAQRSLLDLPTAGRDVLQARAESWTGPSMKALRTQIAGVAAMNGITSQQRQQMIASLHTTLSAAATASEKFTLRLRVDGQPAVSALGLTQRIAGLRRQIAWSQLRTALALSGAARTQLAAQLGRLRGQLQQLEAEKTAFAQRSQQVAGQARTAQAQLRLVAAQQAALRTMARQLTDALALAWSLGDSQHVAGLQQTLAAVVARLDNAAIAARQIVTRLTADLAAADQATRSPLAPIRRAITGAQTRTASDTSQLTDLATLDLLLTQHQAPVTTLQSQIANANGFIGQLTALRTAQQALDQLNAATHRNPVLAIRDSLARNALTSKITSLRQAIAAWTVDAAGVATPPATTLTVVLPLTGANGKQIGTQTYTRTTEVTTNVESPATSRNPLTWAGATITQIGQATTNYQVFRHSLNPYGSVLPVTLSTRTKYLVEMPGGTRYTVYQRSDVKQVRLISPTEMARYSGSLNLHWLQGNLFGQNVTFPTGNLDYNIGSAAQSLHIGAAPVQGELIQVLPRTYAGVESGFLLPGSDTVVSRDGQTAVTVIRHGAGPVSQRIWRDTQPVTRTILDPASPGPRLAPQLKFDFGAGVLVVVPVYLNGVQIGAVGGVFQLQYTNENKGQTPVGADTSAARALYTLASGTQTAWEHNWSREFVLSTFFSIGGQTPLGTAPGAIDPVFGGANLSGVHLNFVGGKALGQVPDLLANLITRIPWLGAALRQKVEEAAAGARLQIQQQAAQQATQLQQAQARTGSWAAGNTATVQPGRTFQPKVLDLANLLSANGQAVQLIKRPGGQDAQLMSYGNRYGTYQPTGNPSPATLAAKLLARYRQLAAEPSPSGQPLAGIVIDLARVTTNPSAAVAAITKNPPTAGGTPVPVILADHSGGRLISGSWPPSATPSRRPWRPAGSRQRRVPLSPRIPRRRSAELSYPPATRQPSRPPPSKPPPSPAPRQPRQEPHRSPVPPRGQRGAPPQGAPPTP